ncbi:MAG: ABC transporter ATP-binding protein [Pseudomonadota bacterium]
MTTSLLEAREISKSFGDLVANDRIDLKIAPGEIHALLGENGAGKSTLVKVIYGSLRQDTGQLIWRGKPVEIGSPSAARRLGIGMVFQHFSLFEPLTVAENIALASDDAGSLREISKRTIELAEQYGLPVKPDALIGDLSVGERQRVEIIRCLLQQPDLIILDEPTSVLTPQEVERLFETLRKLRADGKSILYISHKLDEVRALCDRATVLRRGRVVGSCRPAEETASSLATMMVGETVEGVSRDENTLENHRGETQPLLRVDTLSRPGQSTFAVPLHRISLEVWPGEIVGIAGVAGNGQSELFEALSGEWRSANTDAVTISDQAVGHLGPSARRELGVAFAAEERIGHGAVPGMSLGDNVLLTRHRSDKSAYRGLLGAIRLTAIKRTLRRIVEEMDVRKSGENPNAATLSGGNLQKLIMGREFDRQPKLLIVNQPTWGVDVSAAARIRQGLIDLAASGSGVLVISQDLDELLSICTRVAVLNEGRLSGSLSGGDLNREAIGLLMGGVSAQAKPVVSHAA